MLKQYNDEVAVGQNVQPPSGGCVLKRLNVVCIVSNVNAAAFGRLCVETM